MTNKKNLQTKLDRLEEIVKYFEEGNKSFDLDQGLQMYDEAMKIVQDVKSELQSYELKIDEIQNKYELEENSTN